MPGSVGVRLPCVNTMVLVWHVKRKNKILVGNFVSRKPHKQLFSWDAHEEGLV